MNDHDPQLPIAFTVREAAEYIGVSVQTLYRGIKAGTVPTVQISPAASTSSHERLSTGC